jgi:hypothetical protein
VDNIKLKKFRPRYPDDPAMEEKRQKDQEQDGVTTIYKFKQETDWNFIQRIWKKLKGGE